LLFGACGAWELALRMSENFAYRAAAAIAVLSVLLLVWLVLAVDLIGVEGDRFDLLYAGVIAVGLAGAVLSRLRPAGLSRTLAAMALVQAGIAALALAAGKQRVEASSVLEILGVNGLFVALFLASAWLFRRACRAE